MTNSPAGWFPDPEQPGQMRYWDGNAWTEHRHVTESAANGGGADGPDDRPWFKKKRFIIPAALATLIVISGIAGGGADTTGSTSDGSNAASSAAPADDLDEPRDEAPAEQPVSQEPSVTANASDMVKEFEDNELAADAKYKGKWVQVNGVVNKIDTEMFNSKKYILQIGSGSEWELLTVNCHDMPNEVLSGLSTGNSVSVVGEFSDGGNLGVELKHCRLA